jgi:hypothetical protein
MAAPQAQWLWPHRQEKSKEERPLAASRPQKSQTTSGAKTPRAPPSLTAGCASRSLRAGPRAPARRREEKDSSLDRLDRKKAFAAVKGRHGVNNASNAEAEVLIEDDSDDKDASGGRPRRETRAAKGGRSAKDPADRANDGRRPTKTPPKSGCGVPMHTAVGGRGVPVHAVGRRGVPVHAVVGGRGAPAKIASGSSGDDASLASKNDFASEEEDDERDPDDGLAGEARFAHDKIAVEARFALGF